VGLPVALRVRAAHGKDSRRRGQEWDVATGELVGVAVSVRELVDVGVVVGELVGGP
jgi:hypothetical protein